MTGTAERIVLTSRPVGEPLMASISDAARGSACQDRNYLRRRGLGLFEVRVTGRCLLSRVVLVVNDEPLVLDITVSMLNEFGCEVVIAANAREALEKLSIDERIEILITDINMPGMDGYELAEKAKRMREGLKVIVLSGREQAGSGLPLVRKPFLAQDLRRAMAQHTGLC
jgi:two-component system cell cycle response regulator CpdR